MKKHGIRLKWLLAIGLAVLGVAFLYQKDHVQAADPYVNAMTENISLFDDGSTVTLENVVPFDWDEAYAVSATVTGDQLEKLLDGEEPHKKGVARLVFLRAGKLVAELPLKDSPSTRYRLDFGDYAPAGTAVLHLTRDTPVEFAKSTVLYGSESCALLTVQTDLSACRMAVE